jgi:voltage-gated potassium channel
LSSFFDVTLGPLALVTLVLLIVELLFSLRPPWDDIVYSAQIAIWAVFLVAFVIEIALAPKKLLYLRRNWLLVLALFLPALRVFRAAQALRVLRVSRVARGLTVARGLATVSRATRTVRSFLGFSQMAYLGALVVIVWIAAGGLVYWLEGDRGSGFDSVADSLWWSASVITTVGISIEPETEEGRFVAILLRVFGVAVIGYVTARLAAFFLGGSQASSAKGTTGEVEALRREIAALRAELKDGAGGTPYAEPRTRPARHR